jgi:DNA-binding transcriptional MocR family regulator
MNELRISSSVLLGFALNFIRMNSCCAWHANPIRRSSPGTRLRTTNDVVESKDEYGQSALASRLAGGVGPTVWSEFGKLASELGDSCINLGQGFPDFRPPAFVIEAATNAIQADCHQYTRPAGHPPLVKLLAERYSAHLERKIDPMTEVAVTVGCSQALYVAMQCLVRPGDEVVLFEPYFDLYLGQVRPWRICFLRSKIFQNK